MNGDESMGILKVNYLDASALVKLVVEEKSSNAIEAYMKREWKSSFKATALCFTEALSVLKRKHHLKENDPHYIKFDENTYFTAAEDLIGYVRYRNDSIYTGQILLVDVAIADSNVFVEVEKIARCHSIDVIDAYQIVTVQRDYFSKFPGLEPILITADKSLAKAARAEKLSAWDCRRESAP
jgi:predicted nucleic acid-binding protein